MPATDTASLACLGRRSIKICQPHPIQYRSFCTKDFRAAIQNSTQVTRRNKVLADFGDKLTTELKGRIETALREVKEALARRDARLATERAETLQKVLKEPVR